MIFQWQEIADIPKEPGIYAWYFSPEITDFDLSEAIQKIISLKLENNHSLASGVIRDFLSKNIFRYFQEDPYEASLCGPMKPRYSGMLSHQPTLSASLIERIFEEPERLKSIKFILEKSAPHFASPLYIGMTKKLGKRLMQHKKLIEKYRKEISREIVDSRVENIEDADHSFALEICKRNILPSRLFVIINIFDNQSQKEYVDIENILNRIHYPLLGRN